MPIVPHIRYLVVSLLFGLILVKLSYNASWLMDLDSVIGWLTDVVRITGSVVCRSDELLLRSFDLDFADLGRRERLTLRELLELIAVGLSLFITTSSLLS